MSVDAAALRPALLALLCVGTTLAFSSSCGRKTKVLPPDLVAPQTVEGVTVVNAPAGIAVEWERPTHYVDGSNMLDLAGFRVERRRPCCGYQVIQRVEVEDRWRFRRAKRFEFVDEQVTPGEEYSYRIVAYTIDGYESAPSEPLRIQRQAPAAAPPPTVSPAASSN